MHTFVSLTDVAFDLNSPVHVISFHVTQEQGRVVSGSSVARPFDRLVCFVGVAAVISMPKLSHTLKTLPSHIVKKPLTSSRDECRLCSQLPPAYQSDLYIVCRAYTSHTFRLHMSA